MAVLQAATLSDDLAAKHSESQRLHAENSDMRMELEKRVAQFEELGRTFAAQQAASAQEVEDLTMQLTAHKLTASVRTSAVAAGVPQSGAAAADGAGVAAPAAAVPVDMVYVEDLERQITEAQAKIELLTIEQEQMHDVYKQLEADAARSIDEAMAQERRRVSELELQFQVRCELGHATSGMLALLHYTSLQVQARTASGRTGDLHQHLFL